MIAHSGNLYAGSDLQEDMASGKPCSSGNWEGKWEGLGSDRRREAKGASQGQTHPDTPWDRGWALQGQMATSGLFSLPNQMCGGTDFTWEQMLLPVCLSSWGDGRAGEH